MKKILILIFMLIFLAVFVSGCTAAEILQGIEIPGQPASKCPYYSMRYEGMEVNPQHFSMGYSVDNDRAFVDEIWNAVRYGEWAERGESGQALINISLTFFDENGRLVLVLEVDPNDVGTIRDTESPYTANDEGTYYPNPPKYYDVPAETYKTLSEMLTDYTDENYNIEITPQLIYDLISDNYILTFSSGEIYFVAETEKIGRFADEWDLTNWKEFAPNDGPIDGEIISIHNNTTEILIAVDLKFVYIIHEGRSVCYEISRETAGIIKQQFNEFAELYSD